MFFMITRSRQSPSCGEGTSDKLLHVSLCYMFERSQFELLDDRLPHVCVLIVWTCVEQNAIMEHYSL